MRSNIKSRLSNVLVAILFACTTAVVSAADSGTASAGQWPPVGFCEHYGPGGSVGTTDGGTIQCNGNDPQAVYVCEQVCHKCCSDAYPYGGSDYNSCTGCCNSYNNGTSPTQHCLSSGAKPVEKD